MGKVGSVGCVGFLVEGTGACVRWMRLDFVFLVGRTVSGAEFGSVCELIMILGSLSANGWSCAPVLLVVCHGVSSSGASWSLSGAES